VLLLWLVFLVLQLPSNCGLLASHKLTVGWKL